MPTRRLLLAASALCLPLVAHAQRRAVATTSAPRVESAQLAAMKYRHIGPVGNRVTSIAGIAGDPMTYYAGAASGGIWKTTDAGIHWSPISDDLPVSSIGSISVAPGDPNVVWAGTGEPFIRSHISAGLGMYKSSDAGKTWNKAGLDNSGRIARIAIDPRNTDHVVVAVLGFAYGPSNDRGIYQTLDGGKTWEKTLFVNDSTGGIDVLMDPNNSRILYAAMWQVEIHTWGRMSGGAAYSLPVISSQIRPWMPCGSRRPGG